MWSRWGLTLRSARASSIFPPLTPTAARASERTAVRALWLARATWGAPSRARGRAPPTANGLGYVTKIFKFS